MENFLYDDLPTRQRDILKDQTALVAGASSGIGQGPQKYLIKALVRVWF